MHQHGISRPQTITDVVGNTKTSDFRFVNIISLKQIVADIKRTSSNDILLYSGSFFLEVQTGGDAIASL